MISCAFEYGKKTALRHVTIGTLLLNREKDQILLVRRANIPKYLEPNKIGLPGGFVDRDENIRQAAKREVKEETGYDAEIGDLFRINDNPNRPKEDRQNIEFIFLREALGKTGKFDNEIAATEWFHVNNLPSEEEFAFDHYENVQLLKKYLTDSFPLPYQGEINK